MDNQYEIKVYKMWYEDAPEDFYVGSTKYSSLSKRIAKHRSFAQSGGPSLIYRTMREKGINNIQYVLLGSCMVTDKDEQLAFEQIYIDKLHPTLNSNRARGWDFKRLNQRKRDYQRKPERKAFHKKWREEYRRKPGVSQKERDARQNRKDIRICICGNSYNYGRKADRERHYQSHRHTDYVLPIRQRLFGF